MDTHTHTHTILATIHRHLGKTLKIILEMEWGEFSRELWPPRPLYNSSWSCFHQTISVVKIFKWGNNPKMLSRISMHSHSWKRLSLKCQRKKSIALFYNKCPHLNEWQVWIHWAGWKPKMCSQPGSVTWASPARCSSGLPETGAMFVPTSP